MRYTVHTINLPRILGAKINKDVRYRHIFNR
jgi:hypothetical protein